MTKRMSVVIPLILALVASLVLPGGVATAQDADAGEVIVDGLNAPQGVLVAPDGAVYVVDSGVGGEDEVNAVSPEGETITATVGTTSQIVRVDPDGTQTVVANLPSVLMGDEALGGARLAMLDDELYVTSGGYIEAGPDTPEPMENTAAVLRVGEDGSLETVAPTWRVEKRMNPDDTVVESHPYGIEAGPDGKLWVADAGANTVLRIDPATGQVEVLTVLKPLPGVFPNPLRGGEMLTDPVPTGIAFDDEGNALVSLLSGAPFVPGSTKVVKVGNMGATSDYATGLTMLTDIARGPDGEFYAVQFAEFTDQGPTPNSGAIVHIVEGEGSEPVLEGLSFPTSIDFNEDGDAYISINGAGPPGAGAVIKVAGLAGGEMGAAQATPVATEEATEEPTEEAATPQATEEATAEATEEATAEATEEPTEEATPVATAEATEEATAEATEEPTEEATAVATEEPTEEPTEEVAASATEEATAEATEEATEEATVEALATEEPTEEATPTVTEEPTEEPTEEATPTPTEEATAEATEEPTEEATEEATAAATEEATEEPTAAATEEATEEPTATATAEAEEEVALMDLVDTAAGNDDFSTLVAAIQAADLVDALKSDGPFTVFAPTNEAFEALPEGTLESLLSDPSGDLTKILLYHVVPGKVLASDITDGLEVTTLEGDSLTFSVDGDTVKVNDATVIATDIEATNGVIHVIDGVLLLPGSEQEGEAAGGAAATPEATEEATAEPTEEATAEATAAATEEATAEATAEATEEATVEATAEATAEATEAATEEAATPEETGAPETMPDTGAAQPGALPIVLIVLGVVVALAGGVFMRRRMI